MKKILVMGANPAWQKTLVFKDFNPGAVNRALRMETYPSGKGVNVCRAARCFGKADTLLFQFAGGGNGERLCRGLDLEGVRHETIVTQKETRSCTTCLEGGTGNMTELIEPSFALLPAEADEFLKRLESHISGAAALIISGSLPDGSDPAIFFQAAQKAVSAGIPVVADAVKGIGPVLDLQGRIVLKINQEEFFEITSCSEITAAHRAARSRWSHVCFAVTNGDGEASLSDGAGLCFYRLSDIDVKSPLGAGDTATAVFASEWINGRTPREAFRSALAAASANCLSEKAGQFRPEDQTALAKEIVMREADLKEEGDW